MRTAARTAYDFNRQKAAAGAYRDRCIELLDQGRKPVTITRSTHPQHWRDWRDYYRNHGLLGSLENMDQNGRKSVPTLSPFDFEETPPDRRMVD
jgi:hypothetical protein